MSPLRMQEPFPATEAGKIQPLAGTSGNWAAELTDPNWTGDDSPSRNWERPNPTWDTIGKEIAGLWPSLKEKGVEGPSDADILAFLGLNKETRGEGSTLDEDEKFLEHLGISGKDQSSKLVTLSTEDADIPSLCGNTTKASVQHSVESWEVEVSSSRIEMGWFYFK